MSQPNMTPQEKQKEKEEAKQEFQEVISKIDKQKAIVDFQIAQLKKEGRYDTANANAGWLASFASDIYASLIDLNLILAFVIEKMYESDIEMSKVTSEWQKHKRTLTRYKKAIDHTDETLSQNK